MDKIIESRISQLAQTGFLKEDKELHALLAILNKIANADKFKGLGDQRMIAERVQKEQVSFINNMQEMFSRGDLFLKFFDYHTNAKTKRSGGSIWRVIGLIEKRDSSSFSKVFAQERKSKGVLNRNYSKRKANNSRKKEVSPKIKPQVIKKGRVVKEGS